MRATYSPLTCGTHHIFRRQGLSAFSARRRRTVSRERLACAVSRTISPASSSKVQRARPSGGLAHAVATSSASSLPVSLLLAGELARRARARLLVERPFHAALHEAALDAGDGRDADVEADGDGLV